MQLNFKKPQTELSCSISNLCAAAFPVICSLLLSRLMQITDRFMLAHYSTEALNGAMVAMQAGDILYLPILSIASISEVFVGQMNGKKQFEKTSVPIFQIIIFLTIIWAMLLPLLLYFMSTIIPKELHKSGCPFFVVGIVSIPIYVIFTALSAFFVGTRRPSIIFPAVLAANFLNIFLDATFIFGLFGLPAMGAFGAALASAISSIVSVGILIYFFTNDYNTQKYNTRKIKFDRKLLRKHIELGTPYALSDAAEMIVLYSFVILLNKVSETDLTVYNIALSLWIFFTFLTEGFQKGVIALAANCLGAGKENLIHKLIYSMLIVTVIFAGITSLPMLVFSKQLLVTGFQIENTATTEIFQHTLFALWIAMIILMVECSCIGGILTAGGDTKFVTFVRMLGIFFMVIAILCFFALGKLNAITTWWIGVVQLSFNGIFYYWRYKSGKWKHKIVE